MYAWSKHCLIELLVWIGNASTTSWNEIEEKEKIFLCCHSTVKKTPHTRRTLICYMAFKEFTCTYRKHGQCQDRCPYLTLVIWYVPKTKSELQGVWRFESSRKVRGRKSHQPKVGKLEGPQFRTPLTK